MVFWGKVVGNEHVKVEIPEGGSVYLLQVCLSSISELTSLYVKPRNEKKGFLICHLGASNPQFSLCHELVAEDSPLEMWTTGGQLHVTGTTQEEEGDEEDCSQDDEDEEEEPLYAEECAPTKSENNKNEKRARVVEPVEFAEPTKKTKTTKATPATATSTTTTAATTIAADVVIPQTHQQRKKWKIKPQNDEGVLVLEPKSLKKASGIAITDYIIGKGAEPKLGAKVKITYEGSFPDGTIFDQRLTRGKPFSFRKGTAQVIRGLDLGLEGMRIGGSREVVIPPELGYGKEGVGSVPGNQTLIFRVSLVGQDKKKL